MARMLTPEMLEADNQLFAGTGGISQENRHCGFIPVSWTGKRVRFTVPAGPMAAQLPFTRWTACPII